MKPSTVAARLEDLRGALGNLVTVSQQTDLEVLKDASVLRHLEVWTRILIDGIQKIAAGQIQKGARQATSPGGAAVTETKTVCDHKDANHDRGACTKALQAAVTADAIARARTRPCARFSR